MRSFAAAFALVLFQHLDLELRRHQVCTGGNHQVHVQLVFHRGDEIALFIEQIERHRRRRGQPGALDASVHDLGLYPLQGRQGRRFHRTDDAKTGAGRAHLRRALNDTGAAALARQFHQAKGRNAAHLDARPVAFQRLFHALFHRPVVLAFVHVDEIDDDQPGQVAQAHLAAGLLGGFQIGLQRGGLDIALPRRAPGIDVDRHQRLGLVNHQIAAGFEPHRGAVYRLKLFFDLVFQEDRECFLVMLDPAGMARHQHFHEVMRFTIGLRALHIHRLDVLVIKVAHGTAHKAALLVHQGWRDRGQGLFANETPQPAQIFVIAADFGLGALGARRADDQPDALGQAQIRNNGLQALAVGRIADLA